PLLSVVSSAPHWLQQHLLARLPLSHHLIFPLNYMDYEGHFTPGSVQRFVLFRQLCLLKVGKVIHSRFNKKYVFLSQRDLKLDFVICVYFVEGKTKKISQRIIEASLTLPDSRPFTNSQT
ncbi:hypothetical protein GOODEAATRI_020995, partial [Goodea atripinnis]